ncbi:MAG: hypothetical protein HKM06_05325 [Spirochaetales bacterium]|nr:hypothetical protein [Spirochaetales bacterium]
MRAPPCLRCLHFYITGDPGFPRGCRVFQIKTAGIPSHEIYLSTGRHCPSFEANPKIKASSRQAG